MNNPDSHHLTGKQLLELPLSDLHSEQGVSIVGEQSLHNLERPSQGHKDHRLFLGIAQGFRRLETGSPKL